jgi:hypothetical protein
LVQVDLASAVIAALFYEPNDRIAHVSGGIAYSFRALLTCGLILECWTLSREPFAAMF